MPRSVGDVAKSALVNALRFMVLAGAAIAAYLLLTLLDGAAHAAPAQELTGAVGAVVDAAPLPGPVALDDPVTTVLSPPAPAPLPVTAPAALPVTAPAALPVTAPDPLPVTAPDPLPVAVPAPLPVAVPAPLLDTAPAALPVAAPAPLPVTAPVTAPDPLPATVVPGPSIAGMVSARPAAHTSWNGALPSARLTELSARAAAAVRAPRTGAAPTPSGAPAPSRPPPPQPDRGPGDTAALTQSSDSGSGQSPVFGTVVSTWRPELSCRLGGAAPHAMGRGRPILPGHAPG
jgi:hypothetical protein